MHGDYQIYGEKYKNVPQKFFGFVNYYI